MLDFTTFLLHIDKSIHDMHSKIIKMDNLNILKKIFSDAIHKDSLKSVLLAFHVSVSRFSKESQALFFEKLPKAVNDILESYRFNEFINLLSPFLGEEENEEALTQEDIEQQFSLNLIAHLNKILVKCIGNDLDEAKGSQPKVTFNLEANNKRAFNKTLPVESCFKIDLPEKVKKFKPKD